MKQIKALFKQRAPSAYTKPKANPKCIGLFIHAVVYVVCCEFPKLAAKLHYQVLNMFETSATLRHKSHTNRTEIVAGLQTRNLLATAKIVCVNEHISEYELVKAILDCCKCLRDNFIDQRKKDYSTSMPPLINLTALKLIKKQKHTTKKLTSPWLS